MFDPELCHVPICASTPHEMLSVLLVRCRHSGGFTAHIHTFDDQVTHEERSTVTFGPFDQLIEVLGQVMELVRLKAERSLA